MEFKKAWKFLGWDVLEKVCNNQFSKLIGALPVIGYFILFNDEIADVLTFKFISGQANTEVNAFFLNSLLKLRLIFFGSILLFLSNMFFLYFRPEELKVANGEFAFSGVVKESYTIYDLRRIEDQVFGDNWRPRLHDFWFVNDSQRPKNRVVSGHRYDARNAMFHQFGDYIDLLSREWWVGQMYSKDGARYIAFSSAVCAYCMLALPSLDILQAVVRDLIF